MTSWWLAWMRILLDESAPRRLKELLQGHEVRTVQEHRWRGKENGELLDLASREFEVFVTPDRNLPSQQNLAQFEIAIVVLAAGRNRMRTYEPLVDQIRQAVKAAKAGETKWVTA